MEPEQNTQAHCSKGLWEIEFSGFLTFYLFPFFSLKKKNPPSLI